MVTEAGVRQVCHGCIGRRQSVTLVSHYGDTRRAEWSEGVLTLLHKSRYEFDGEKPVTHVERVSRITRGVVEFHAALVKVLHEPLA
jgi:hypothetical protein